MLRGQDPMPDIWYFRLALYLDCSLAEVLPPGSPYLALVADFPPSMRALVPLWQTLTAENRLDAMAHIQSTYGVTIPRTPEIAGLRK
jgi:hypothetical protein